ncbi:MAG: endonuclease/exonuclease/phosphatase family protein [Pedosphaera parvula]|nr:endonuclease/exonuclease/phosphatase family protein [Pedosphaera parvula]
MLAACGAVLGPARAADTLTVATYNIRRIVDEPREFWKDRRPLMVQCIRAIAPDVMGTQEGLYPQIKDLENDLPEFRWIGLGRDGGSDDEFCAIFYRTQRLEPLAFGHFWLSDYPEVMGSITWGTQFRRMCTWVRFRDLKTGREFSVWNTHFDHQVQEAREKSAALIRERVERWEKDRPAIVLGDFNSRAGVNPAYETLTRDGFLTDTWLTATKPPELPKTGTATFNGWGDFPLGDARIDWVLTRGPWTTERVEIVTFAVEGRYPSDHFPVVARLRLGKAGE